MEAMPIRDDRTIYLIGPRASGKTTLGRSLAERLSRPFVDLDAVFLERTGETIAALVAREGWDAFRRRESVILADVAATPGQVVATGGGAVLMPENREVLGKGLVFYLQAAPERLAERLLADMRQALAAIPAGIETEVSGGVDQEALAGIRALGPDFVSVGRITHSAPSADFSMLLEEKPAA